MSQRSSVRYCSDSERCSNAGEECDHCTRSWDYEEAWDEFEEIEPKPTLYTLDIPIADRDVMRERKEKLQSAAQCKGQTKFGEKK